MLLLQMMMMMMTRRRGRGGVDSSDRISSLQGIVLSR
jgi:hypothetical protein